MNAGMGKYLEGKRHCKILALEGEVRSCIIAEDVYVIAKSEKRIFKSSGDFKLFSGLLYVPFRICGTGDEGCKGQEAYMGVICLAGGGK